MINNDDDNNDNNECFKFIAKICFSVLFFENINFLFYFTCFFFLNFDLFIDKTACQIRYGYSGIVHMCRQIIMIIIHVIFVRPIFSLLTLC